jgi:N6-adenosine-specific RNA methylase IME4
VSALALYLPRTPGGWQTIVADPNWIYKDKGSRLYTGGGYAQAGVDEIARMPVAQIAARDAFLFLWATDAAVLEGSAAYVAAAWGFVPKRMIVWVKGRPSSAPFSTPVLHIGGGHYVRTAHEVCLICRRGRARVSLRNVPSVFFAKRRRHSEKPEELQTIAERIAPGFTRRLELYARRRRFGWECFGDQIEGRVAA